MLINDVMDDSSKERFPLEMRSFRLHSLIKETAYLAKCLCSYEGYEFKIDVDKSLPDNVMGDDTRVFQLMQGKIWAVPNLVGFDRSMSLVLRFQLRPSIVIGISENGESSEHNPLSNSLFRGLQVLLADEDDTNRAVTRKLLEKLGCIVSTVATGSDCVNAINQPVSAYQMVILDLHMPDIDGFEVASRIRKTRSRNWPLIIALTTAADEDSAGESVLAKARIVCLMDAMWKTFASLGLISLLFVCVFASSDENGSDNGFSGCNCEAEGFFGYRNIMETQRVSDFLIAVAYFSIPIELLYFISCSNVPFKWVLFEFTAFIVLCGMTHLLTGWTYEPHPFHLMLALTIFKFLTALVSFATAITLITLIPLLLKVKVREFMLKKKTRDLGREMGVIMQQKDASWHVRMLTQEIRKSLDRHTILYTTLDKLSETLDLHNCAIWMPDAAKTVMSLTHQLKGGQSSTHYDFSIPIQDPDVQEVKGSDTVKLLDQESRLASLSSGGSDPPGAVAAIRMPMLRVSDFKGGTPEMIQTCYAILVLVLPGRQVRSWTDPELEIVKVVADQVAVALSHAAVLEESQLMRDKLAEQNRALQLAKQDAMRASQARNLFQTVMSKSLRKPMHSIMGLLSIVQDENLSNQQRVVVDSMMKTSNVLSMLINDVMDDSSKERFPLEMRSFRLHSLIKETAYLAKCLCSYKGYEFKIDVDKSLPDNVMGDDRRVFQVILHMVGNLLNRENSGSGGSLMLRIAMESGSQGRSDQRWATWRSNSSDNYLNLMQGKIWVVPNLVGFDRSMSLVLRFQLRPSIVIGISENEESSEHNPLSNSLFRGLQVLLADEDDTNRAVTPLTTAADEGMRERCLQMGINGVIHKPVLLQGVSDELRRVLKKEPQGKVGTQGCPNQVRKPGAEARSFQITGGERSGKKNGVQKTGKGVFHRLGDKEKNVSAHSRGSERKEYSRRAEPVLESKGSARGHSKSKPKKQKSSMEDDLSQPWVCEETYTFTPRIHYFDFPKTRMPSHIKTYDGSEDPKDHLKIFQAAAKTERWAMPTWCHMFNSTLTGNARVWFDDLPKESIDSYDDLRKAFLENYLQQKKCIKDPVEIHNIKQRNGESTEEFVKRYKLECRDREMAASNRERKKPFPPWKQETGQKHNFKRGNFLNEQRMERKQDRFTLLTKTSREILALDKGKFKPPPPMTTPVEKMNASKFCWKTLTLIKELKQNQRKDQAKIAKKGGTSRKDKPLAILMVQPWQKIARQRITQTFSSESIISFPTLREEDGMEGPMIIEVEMRGHCVHRIYVDGGSSSEILYKHCFSKFLSEIKNQLTPANTPLIGFSRKIIWSLGQILLLVRVGDEEHSTSAWINFMEVRSPSPYNGIIERPGDHSARFFNGFKTKSTTVCHQPSQRRKNTGDNSSGTSETNHNNRIYPNKGRKELCGLLRRHLDVFVWKPIDMTGVPRHIAEHKLNVREGCLPLSVTRNRLKGRIPLRVPLQMLPRRVQGILSDKIAEEDEEKTTFITSQGIFCYSKMPFRLKNAGATYQRLVDRAFQKQIGRNLEVYVDDLVIKSRTEKEVIRDTEETFKTLRKINMKLNPKKCAFGMREGTFLGYKVDADGLRVSPDKVKAVLDLSSPKCLKEGAFKEMKQSIAELPMITAPKEKEELIMYLAAAKEAISAVLMIERDGKQVPVYFVSRALQGPEINYTPMEKLILTLRPEDDAPDTPMEDREELPDQWILFTDGSSCVDSFGAGLIITNPEGMEFTYTLRFRFNATNNEAEYEADMC
nr:ethylene receptor 2-like [Tanacetum cinerariifolium]